MIEVKKKNKKEDEIKKYPKFIKNNSPIDKYYKLYVL